MTGRALLTRAACAGCFVAKPRSIVLLVLLAASTANGWQRSNENTERDPGLQDSEMAVLASSQPRADFSCQVTPDKPILGFDLQFHSDYRATIPIRVIADAGGWLQVTMRVTPEAEIEKPTYLVHRYATPGVPVGAKGDVTLTGGLHLGLGRYRLDWMMSDARQRVCSSHWNLEARPGYGQRDLPLTLGPNKVADAKIDGSADDVQVQRDLVPSLGVKILLNLTPAQPQRSIVRPEDAAVLLSMLRSIAGQPGIARFTVVAFNLRAQKIVYRDENADHLDFAALSKILQSPISGTIDSRLLDDPQSETQFTAKLLIDQLGGQAHSPDAIFIVGPKVRLDKKVPLEALKKKGEVMCPLFYLNYNADPFNEPWPDTIGSALKAYKGALAYNILYPRDLGVAMREMLSRIVKRPPSDQSF